MNDLVGLVYYCCCQRMIINCRNEVSFTFNNIFLQNIFVSNSVKEANAKVNCKKYLQFQ